VRRSYRSSGSGLRRRLRRVSRQWRHLVGAVLAALLILPLVFMITGSLRKTGLPPPRTPELVPSPLAFDNYSRAFDLVDIPRYLLNSTLVAAAVVPLTIVFASWAGFAIARLPGRLRRTLVGVSLVALMVPLTALLVPRFVIFKTLGMTDTYWPLILPAVMGLSPFYVLIFYWAFRQLPEELYEASRLEGLSPLLTWWRVAMPLIRPVTVAVGVLAFLFSWGNFLDPLIYLFDERKFTLPLGLRSLATLDRQDFPLLLAGAVTATVPVILAFLYVQRFFLQEHRGRGWLGR
jgi:multiple sugar transport system permease protein